MGKKGRTASEKAALSDADAFLLRQNLKMLDELDSVIREDEQWIARHGEVDRKVAIVSSIPGIGLIGYIAIHDSLSQYR